MQDKKFYRANGDLTAYAMACGFIMATNSGQEYTKLAGVPATGLYTVHATAYGRELWRVFETYGEALAEYKKLTKQLERETN